MEGIPISKKTLDYAYLSYFFTEMAAVMKAGIGPAEGFSLMAEGEKDPDRQHMLLDLYDRTDAGMGLTEALEEAGVFPGYVLQMVRIGEVSGCLDTVFPALGRYCEEKLRTARMIRSAVVYPAVLLVVMLAILTVFITRILPVFGDVFRQIGATMSGPAMAFMNFGLKLRQARWVLLAVLLLIVLAALAIRCIPKLNAAFTAWLSRLTARTKVGRKIGTARFASALDLAFSGGVELDDAIALSRFFCNDPAVAEAVDRCRARLSEGESIDKAFSEEKIFTPMCCHLLRVGVQTGETETVLKDIARRTDEEMEQAVAKLTGAVEPCIVVLLCICVGLLLLGVMLPLVGIMSAL